MCGFRSEGAGGTNEKNLLYDPELASIGKRERDKKERGTGQISGGLSGNDVGLGVVGANLRLGRQTTAFRQELNSETYRRALHNEPAFLASREKCARSSDVCRNECRHSSRLMFLEKARARVPGESDNSVSERDDLSRLVGLAVRGRPKACQNSPAPSAACRCADVCNQALP